MPAYSGRYRLIKQDLAALNWHTPMNALIDLVDSALGQVLSIDVTSSNVTLTTNNNSADQSRAAVYLVVGTPGTTRSITLPQVERTWRIKNNSDSSLVLTTGTGAAQVSLNTGEYAEVYSDGANSVIVLHREGGTTPASAAFQRGFIDGFILSNNVSDTANDIAIAAGKCRDSTDSINITGSGAVRQVNVAFNSGNGGRFPATTVDGTWHVFVISNGSAVNFGMSTNLNPTSDPNYPAGYTWYRRIGSFRRSGGVNAQFVQFGDKFLLKSGISSYSDSNPGTARILVSLFVPVGIVVEAIFAGSVDRNINATSCFVSFLSPDQTDVAPSSTELHSLAVQGNSAPVSGRAAGEFVKKTDTNGRIALRLSASASDTFVYITTGGWIDPRGKNE